MLWLRDSESCGTRKSVATENLELIDTTFDFDRVIFGSKVYRMATRSNMIRALLDDTKEDAKSVITFPATVTDLHGDADESDVQTIRQQPVETSRLANGLQGQFAEVSIDVQLEIAPNLESPNRPPISMHTHRERRRSAEARKQAHRKSLSIPGLFRPQPPPPVTSQQDPEDFKTIVEQPLRVLILGTSESGKSTLVKSILASQGYYTDDVRRICKPNICNNIVESMRSIITAMKILPLEDAEIETSDIFEGHCRTVLESDFLSDDDLLSPRITFAITELWKHPRIKKVLERSDEFCMMDCAK